MDEPLGLATPDELWAFLPWGYLLTTAIETPVLWFGLSQRHGSGRRIAAGFWLTACTYPIVVLVLPSAMHDLPRWAYLAVAETFAPAAECALFYAAFLWKTAMPDRRATLRDMAAITLANLASFGLGELVGPQLASWIYQA